MKFLYPSADARKTRFLFQDQAPDVAEETVEPVSGKADDLTQQEQLEKAIKEAAEHTEIPEIQAQLNVLIQAEAAQLVEKGIKLEVLEAYLRENEAVPLGEEGITGLAEGIEQTVIGGEALTEEELAEMQGMTNEQFLQQPREARLRFVTKGNVEASSVASGSVKDLEFTFTYNGEYNEALWEKTTAGQVLPPEVRSVNSNGQVYHREADSLQGEFFAENGQRLKIHEGTVLSEVFTDPEAAASVQEAIDKKLEDFEGTDGEALVAAQALAHGFDPSFVQSAFVAQGNEIKVEDDPDAAAQLTPEEEARSVAAQRLTPEYSAKLENFLTEIDRVKETFTQAHPEVGLEDGDKFTSEFVSGFMGRYSMEDREEVMQAYGFSASEIEDTLKYAQRAEGGYLVDIENLEPGIDGLLDIIGMAELSPAYADNYNAEFGNAGQSRLDFTSMSLREVLAHQDARVAAGAPSSAIGRYQFIRGTLRGLVQKHGLSLEQKFTPELQDQLAISLMEEKGLRSFQTGSMSAAQFQRGLAATWASLPTSSANSATYYQDGLNMSSSKIPQEVLSSQLRTISEA